MPDEPVGPRSGLVSTLRSSDQMWYYVFLLALIVSTSMVFLPFFDVWINDNGLRYILFLVLLSIMVLVMIVRLAPKEPDFQDFDIDQELPDIVSEATAYRAVEGRTIDQMGMYQELKSTFANRVRSRRGIREDEWEKIENDRTRLKSLVGDDDLVRLLMERTNTRMEDGQPGIFLYGEDFKTRFILLLKKVEGWR